MTSKRNVRRLAALFVFGGLSIAATHCSSSSTGTLQTPAPAGSAVVGASGGSVQSADGAATIRIPAGALDHDVSITLAPTTPPLPGAVGTVYEIGPTGTTFARPVTVAIHADGASLHVATVEGTTWKILADAAFDASTSTASGTTMHLSPYGVVSSTGEDAGPDAPSIDGGGGDGGSPDASSRDATADSAPACMSDSSSGPAGGPYPRCATSHPCSSLPGTYVASCTDTATGYTATCCPSADAGATEAGPADAPAGDSAPMDSSVPGDASSDASCVGTLCGASCVDLATDPANCGACFAACPTGVGCAGGTCTGDAGGTDAGAGDAGGADTAPTDTGTTSDACVPSVCSTYPTLPTVGAACQSCAIRQASCADARVGGYCNEYWCDLDDTWHMATCGSRP